MEMESELALGWRSDSGLESASGGWWCEPAHHHEHHRASVAALTQAGELIARGCLNRSDLFRSAGAFVPLQPPEALPVARARCSSR